jgi:hypothetical protein
MPCRRPINRETAWIWSEHRFPDPAEAATRMREALRKFGCDADAVSVDEAAAERVSGSAVGERIVAALEKTTPQPTASFPRAESREAQASCLPMVKNTSVSAAPKSRVIEKLLV